MMYDMYIMKRTQIYLDVDQDGVLARRAQAAGVTKSTMIREAISAYLASPGDSARLERYRAALEEVEASPAKVGDGRSYVERLRRDDERRQVEIERRRG
jgi:predicted DNA-binding protein